MSTPDLNLLFTLNALLAEGSVAAAARRLRLSPSAMSRSLARLRTATGDPLLVRAGRGLVPTPRALELRERVRLLVDEAEAALRPATRPDLRQLTRSFTVRASEGYAETFGPGLIARIAGEAPGVQLRFVSKTDKEGRLLRDGAVDLETGVVAGTASPELRVQALFQDRFVGVVRSGHPLCEREVSAQAYAGAMHVATERRGGRRGPVDEALAALGLQPRAAATVSGFATALALARSTDLVATVPERHTHALRAGMHSFALPFATRDITVSMLWHPRLHADPAHRWLRQCVRDVCAQVPG